MPPSPTRPATPAATYRAGTLVYDAAGLRNVFAWLLGAEVVYTLIDMLEPLVLPILLKAHGATDTQIGIMLGSFTAGLQLLIMPPLGYWSDRLRTKWGRRIPVLFWATPFVSLFLALTPFAPDIANRLLGIDGLGAWMQSLSVAPAVLVFGVLVFSYRVVQTVTNTMFFGLLRDVIPESHMGRFLALFRVFGAAGTAIITYWLLGHVENHSKPIFLGVAVLNLVCFLALCRFVREGEYPPVEEVNPNAAGKEASFWDKVRTFCRESYSHPVYLWMYFIRVCLYGVQIGLLNFIVFFPQKELGLSLTEIGHMRTWPLFVWVLIAFPIGSWVDKKGAIFVLQWGLWLITLGYLGTVFLVVGPITYLISALVTGTAFWIVMMAQLKLTQEIFHPQRYSQLAGANTIVQSALIAIIISPGAGWVLDQLKGWHTTLALPGAGDVDIGPYRLVNLMIAVLYGAALFGLAKIRQHVRAHGGPDHYAAPL